MFAAILVVKPVSLFENRQLLKDSGSLWFFESTRFQLQSGDVTNNYQSTWQVALFVNIEKLKVLERKVCPVIMEDLPALVFSLIFECHLSLKDQVRCTQVCRKWRTILDPFKRKRLFLHFGPFPRRKRSCTNEPIRFQDSFEIRSVDFLRHRLTRSYFKRIKQLTIFNIYHDSNQLEIGKALSKYLHYFQELDCLELEGFSLTNKSQLSLKNLKTLSLKNCRIQKPLELNLPNLEHFISWAVLLENVTFKHANSIRSMQYYNHHRNCRFKTTFENLEAITIFDINGYLLKNFLSRLPKLQRLVLYSQMTENDFKELKRQRNEIFNLKDLQIHHFGYDESLGYRKSADCTKTSTTCLTGTNWAPWLPAWISWRMAHRFQFTLTLTNFPMLSDSQYRTASLWSSITSIKSTCSFWTCPTRPFVWTWCGSWQTLAFWTVWRSTIVQSTKIFSISYVSRAH